MCIVDGGLIRYQEAAFDDFRLGFGHLLSCTVVDF